MQEGVRFPTLAAPDGASQRHDPALTAAQRTGTREAVARAGGEQAPPRPVFAFQVGVTGHRHLQDADPSGISLAAATLFRELGEQALALYAADQAENVPLYLAAPPRLRCLCGLAEGADSILAEAALDAGWEIVALLPFGTAEFAADFTGAALSRYQAILARATSVCTLDGDRDAGTAYAEMGELLAEQSDMLLAVWDGKPANGPGGTGDVVQRCRDRGLPVAVIPTVPGTATTWLDGGHGGSRASMQAMLRSVLLPPDSDRAMVRSFLSEGTRRAAWAHSALRTYERIVTFGVRQPAMPPVPPSQLALAAPALNPAFLAADRLAAEYAAHYRAAGLMRYGLILPATLASLLGWYGATWLQPLGNLADATILAFLLYFSAKGWWAPAQQRFVAYRAVAEYLRNAGMLAPLGAVARAPGGAIHEKQSGDWIAWYCRAIVRGPGPGALSIDPVAIDAARGAIRAETLGQVAFLIGRASRFDAMAKRLRQIGVALFFCGMAFSALRGVLLLVAASPSAMREFNELALVLPAMAPIFLGLLSFNEYGKLATRYRRVAEELQAQLVLLEAAAQRRGAVLAVARRVADIMLAEGADWQQLIKAREVSAY